MPAHRQRKRAAGSGGSFGGHRAWESDRAGNRHRRIGFARRSAHPDRPVLSLPPLRASWRLVGAAPAFRTNASSTDPARSFAMTDQKQLTALHTVASVTPAVTQLAVETPSWGY